MRCHGIGRKLVGSINRMLDRAECGVASQILKQIVEAVGAFKCMAAQEFAVGVVSKEGDYRLIDSGPLPEAVAASAAIPWIFNPVNIPGKVPLL